MSVHWPPIFIIIYHVSFVFLLFSPHHTVISCAYHLSHSVSMSLVLLPSLSLPCCLLFLGFYIVCTCSILCVGKYGQTAYLILLYFSHFFFLNVPSAPPCLWLYVTAYQCNVFGLSDWHISGDLNSCNMVMQGKRKDLESMVKCASGYYSLWMEE